MSPANSRQPGARTVSLTTLFMLAVIIALGVFLRAQAFLGTDVVEPLQGDAAEAYELAQVLDRQGAFQVLSGPFDSSSSAELGEVYSSLGYPLFLSLFVGEGEAASSLNGAVITQIVLGALVILLVFMLATRLLDPYWGLTVALLTAISPYLVNISLYLVGSTLLMVALLFYLLTTAKISDRGALLRSFFAAALLGVVAWVDATYQFLILPWVILLFFSSKGASKFLVPVAAVLGFALVFGPLIAMNQTAIDTAVPTASMAASIQEGMRPAADTAAQAPTKVSLIGALGQLGGGLIDDPRGFLNWYFVEKPQVLWSLGGPPEIEQTFVYAVSRTPYADNPGFLASEEFMELLHGPVVLLGLLGLILVWLPFAGRRLSSAQLIGLRTLSLVVVYATLAHLFGVAAPQHATPLMPLVFMMALTPLYLITLPRPRQQPAATAKAEPQQEDEPQPDAA